MHRTLRLFFISLLFLPIALYSQKSDFISLQKNERTIKSYFKGSPFQFVHKNGAFVDGVIVRVYRDSIYMNTFDIRMMPTLGGGQVLDTMATYEMKFGIHEIGAIPKPAKGFEFIRNGTLLMIGGVGYAFLHTFNGLIQKRKIYPSTVAIAGGVALVGFTMKKTRKYYYTIGKKYTISYVQLNSE